MQEMTLHARGTQPLLNYSLHMHIGRMCVLGQARVGGDGVSLLLRGEWLVGEDGSVGEGLMMMRLSRLYKHREIVNSFV